MKIIQKAKRVPEKLTSVFLDSIADVPALQKRFWARREKQWKADFESDSYEAVHDKHLNTRVEDLNYYEELASCIKYIQQHLDIHLVVEFGAGSGVNAKFFPGCEFIGIDPAKGILNNTDITHYRMDDCEFVESNLTLPIADVSIFRGVLLFIPGDRARRVFDKIAKRSKYIIVAENINHAFSKRTHLWRRRYFCHPYAAWASQNSLRLVHQLEKNMDSVNGYLVYENESLAG